jgi:serine/threonine protein kinase
MQASIPTEAGKDAASKSAPPTQEELAAAFPQLDILGLIGQGGMGFVFKARQARLDRFVALKILPASLAADPAFAERFTREGRMLARLNHPNIVAIHDFGVANGFFYLVMEFVDGVNLRQAMKVGRCTPAQALAIVPDICAALQFAHNEGILHRDIKPENILLDSKGRVKIADFGIAKLVGADRPAHTPSLSHPMGEGGAPAPGEAQQPNLTETGKALGTPNYMAPEQIEHPQDVDQRADIYSLGVVFYEMLTGELPLGRFAPPSEKSAVDARVDEIVLRTLEKERERRTQTAGEVKTQVETIAGSGPLPPAAQQPVGVAAAYAQAKPDRFWRWFAVAVLALIAIPVAIALLGMLAAIAIPNFVKARQRALAAHEQQAALPSPTNPPAAPVLPGRPPAIDPVTGLPVPAAPPHPAQPDTSSLSAASAETWSPEVAPGGKRDLHRILEEAKQLTSAGLYEEALQRYIWFHNHEQEYGDSYQDVVRITSAVSEWEELGRRYPKAKRAMIEIRDHKTKEIVEGRGYVELVKDVQAINHALQDDDATYALFKTVREQDPKLAGHCYYYLESLLVSKGEYQWCLSQMGDSQRRFDLIRQGLDMDRDNQKRMAESRQRTAQQMAAMNQKRGWTNSWSPPDTSAMMKKSGEDRFVGQTCQLIEILVGTGHQAEAEKLRDQAVAILDDPRLRSAMSDAAEKLQKQSTRANAK